ncbi:MAG: flagellar biosynthesis protein FlgL [Rhodobacter sp.]|nr:flagellar biosynthesis protein FlgL [Rhodobacter sp.]
MQPLTFGDMASPFRLQASNQRLKTELQRLGQELASGKTADLRATTKGDLGNYAGLESVINALGAYHVAANEAALFTEAIQRSLETVQVHASEIGPALLIAGSTGEATLVQTAATDARSRFAAVVSVLNTKIADRAILSGTAIGADALAGSETMLADLQIAIAAETTAAGVAAAVDAWFDDTGGGFETSGYLGSTTDLAPFRLGPDEQGSLSVRGDDQNIRDVLKGFAMAALVSDGALAADHDERVALIGLSATQILSGDKALAELRAEVGTAEGQIETARTRNDAEVAALEMARSEIVRVDPYTAATDLQAAETQLQTLYTITARLSRLSLAEYL